jgi:hypothetical protein
MAVNTALTTMVRHLISDLGSTERYADSRINTTIVMAGLYTSQIFEYANTYTFDLSTPDITPDPVDTDTLDNQAIALITLKAACMLDINRYQDNADCVGVVVRDEDSIVDTKEAFRGYLDIIKMGPCAAYEKMIKKLESDKSMGIGMAIVSPATHPDALYRTGSHLGRSFFDQFLGFE